MFAQLWTTAYRWRAVLVLAGALVFLASAILTTDPQIPGVAAVAVAIGVVAGFSRPVEAEDDPSRTVASPVGGRWLAVNSPSSRVPSHGVRAYGQAYAIDLARWPDEGGMDWGTGWARPDTIAGFGDPVHAMVDGEVVRASGWRRDHRCRTSKLATAYLMLEGVIRELGGPGWIVGNHVIVRSDDGAFAMVAHLRRGSLRVRVGDRVRAGEVIAACGNSGNSSVPHVHAQLMDRASVSIALGLPLRLRDVAVEPADADLPDGVTAAPPSDPYPGVPADGELLVARPG